MSGRSLINASAICPNAMDEEEEEEDLGPSNADEGEETEGREEDDISLVGPESDENDNFGGDQEDDEL
jgi:hypothetical protein